MSDMERTEFRLPDGFDVDRDVDTRLQAGEQESETTLRPKNLDEFIAYARMRVENNNPTLTYGEDYQVHVHTYGAGAIMGEREADRSCPPTEIGIVVEVMAPEPETARMVCRMFRKTLMVAVYPGQKATTGKAAIMADEELKGMDSYKWTIYHTMKVSSGLDHSRVVVNTVDGRSSR